MKLWILAVPGVAEVDLEVCCADPLSVKDLQRGQTAFPVNWKSKGLIGLEFNIFWQEHILKELCVPIPRRLAHLDAARVDPFFFFLGKTTL